MEMENEAVNYTPHPVIAGVLPDGRSIKDVLRYITGDYYINIYDEVVSPHVQKEFIHPEATTQRVIVPRSSILHTNAGPRLTPWEALIAYWRRSDINGEAHFQIPLHGRAIQAMPLNKKADCNYKANGFYLNNIYYGAISFETGDEGYATLDSTPWTPSQLKHLIAINTCLAVVYNIWCTAPTTWYDSGIGHHVLFKEWSSYTGKTCPGAARIRQMDYIRHEVALNLAEFGEITGWKCGVGFV